MKSFEQVERIERFCNYFNEWTVVKDEEILKNYGEDPWNREISRYISKSIIVLDKPPGPSSHQVAYWVKQLLGVQKAGHGGTLES
ncbi:tRNA pseudouridine synthase A [Sulfolobales archaeon HS-7]|nr:tRNA pseudouridine synthase A [Sulfolobales archaeon HS-7]